MATDVQLQGLVAVKLKVAADATVTGTVIPVAWDLYAGMAKSQYAIYLYVTREVAEYVMGFTRDQVDVQVGPDRVSAGQLFEHARRIYQNVDTLLQRVDPEVPTLVTTNAISTLPDTIEEDLSRINSGLSPLDRVIFAP